MSCPRNRHLEGRGGSRLAASVLLGLAACSSETPSYGPLPVRDQRPDQLTVLHMDPRTARVLEKGTPDLRVDAAYSSLFESSAGGELLMDGEILRLRLKGRVGLGRGWETWIEVPVAYTTGGFLDSFLIEWHDILGLPDHDRSTVPNNEWLVRARDGGTTVYEMDGPGELELMDIPVGMAWNPGWLSDPSADLLFRGAVELPTGNQDAGFGNGEVDVSLGVVGEYRFEGWALTGHLQHTFAGTPQKAQAAGFEFGDVTSLGLEAEIALGPTTTGLIQTEVESSTLRGLDVPSAQDPPWLLYLGARQLLGQGFYLEAGFGEDLLGTSPDFTAWLGIGWMPSLAPERGPR